MATTGTAITLTLGAALAGGWASTFGQANNDIGILGRAIAKSRDEQKALGAPDHEGHKKNAAALASARKALDDYNAKLSGNTSLTEEQSAILGHLTKQHEKAQKAYNASEKAVRDRTIALKAEGKDVDALARKHAALTARIQKQVALGAAWAKTRQSLASFGKTAAAGIGVLSAATAAAYKFVNATAAEGEALQQSSARLGVTVSALQEYQFVAGGAGMETAKFEAGLDKLGQGLDDAIIKRSGPAHDALQRLGLDARALATMPADERLNAIADALANVSDENARAAISGDLFGKDAGRGFNTMLRGGSKALASGRADARAAGAVWDTKGADDYQNSLDALKTSWASLGRIVGSQLMPAFTRLNKTLGAAITGNGGQVGKAVAAIADVFTNLVPVLGAAANIAASFFGVLGKSPWIVKAAAVAVGALGVAIGAVKLYGVILGVIALTKAVWGFTASLFTCPVTWIVLGLVAIGAAIYALWRNWDVVTAWLGRVWAATWDGIKFVFTKAWEGIVWYFSTVWNGIKTVALGAWDFLKAVFAWSPLGLVIKAYGAVFKWLEDKFAIFSKIGGAVKWMAGKLGLGGGDNETPAAGGKAKVVDTTIPVARGGSKTITNSIGKIEIHAPPGVDAEEVARLAAQRIQEQQAAMLDGALADPA